MTRSRFNQVLYLVFVCLGIAWAAAYVFEPGLLLTFAPTDLSLMGYLFALFTPLIFISYKKKTPWWAYILFALMLACLSLSAFYALTGINEGWAVRPPLYFSVIGMIVWVLAIEAGRRAGGIVFAVVVFVLSVIPFFSAYLPPPFTSQSYPALRLPAHYVQDTSAIYGPASTAFVRYIIGYLIFGGVLEFIGGGQYLIGIALRLVGGLRGATAKVSVVTSCIFGTLSGSAVANVLTIGTVTIPAMKRSGYNPYYAGAVEACASTGGLIMPPVMGAVAFVMAQMTQIPYPKIALAAFIPGFLYYLAIFVQTDIQAIKLGIKAIPKEERGTFSLKSLLQGWHIWTSAAVLVYLIFWPQKVEQAPYFALMPLIIGAFINRTFGIRQIPELLSSVGKTLVSMAALFVCLGLVTGAFIASGIGLAIPLLMLSVGQGQILVVILMAGLIAVVLGMGIAVTAVYILVAIVFAPGLIKLGLNPMAVHLFIVYYAAIASFTPPVGLASAAAAQLAGASYFRTGFQACRLGAVMFFVPLYFVHQPSLVLQGTASGIVTSLGICLFAIVLMSVGFERYMYGVGKISWPEAIACFTCGFIILLPIGPPVSTIAWGLSVALILYWCVKFLLSRRLPKKGLNPVGP